MAKVEVHDQSTADIQLLTDEKGGLGYEEGISTLTFYTGDIDSARQALRNQFTKVVEKNPWIAGRLVKHKQHKMVLQHPNKITNLDIEPLFKTFIKNDQLKLDPSIPYTQMCTNLYKTKEFVVGTGPDSLKRNTPITIL